jgi:hypothetical protein
MNLYEIISSIRSLRPDATDEQLVRLTLMMLVSGEELREDCLPETLVFVEQSNRQRNDQLSAVAEELDSLASTQPSEFCPSHIWTLLKAIRVQKQMLDLYEGDAVAEAGCARDAVCEIQ